MTLANLDVLARDIDGKPVHTPIKLSILMMSCPAVGVEFNLGL